MCGGKDARVEVYETKAGRIDVFWLVDGRVEWWRDYCGSGGDAADDFLALSRGINPTEKKWACRYLTANSSYAFDLRESTLIATAGVGEKSCQVYLEALCSAGDTFAWRLVSDGPKYVVEDLATGNVYVCDGILGLAHCLKKTLPASKEAVDEMLRHPVATWEKKTDHLAELAGALNITVNIAVECRRDICRGPRLRPELIYGYPWADGWALTYLTEPSRKRGSGKEASAREATLSR